MMADAARRLARLAATLVALMLTAVAGAQDGAENDSAPAPRDEARLEQPEDDDRAEVLEEILVVGQAWRLPDLGSTWRQEREEEVEIGRIDFVALPLYDPESKSKTPDIHALGNATDPVRFVEIFRIRFGNRD